MTIWRDGFDTRKNFFFATLNNLQRRQQLAEQWFFECSCPRCRDPTEFGTRTSRWAGTLLPY